MNAANRDADQFDSMNGSDFRSDIGSDGAPMDHHEVSHRSADWVVILFSQCSGLIPIGGRVK